MQTVESIIKSVYGRAVVAADKLGVLPSAVSNWKKSGYFPSRVIIPLCEDARELGIPLDVSEIPVMQQATRCEA
jgi:hypothetical protein